MFLTSAGLSIEPKGAAIRTAPISVWWGRPWGLPVGLRDCGSPGHSL